MTNDDDREIYDDYTDYEDDIQVDEYDITTSPNDFNISTIYSFLESGAVKIPGFQRNFVWDIGHASKLIESLILGLPVPQIFLYETRNRDFLVIDGQQRLMSIYYFIKQRFPRKEKRSELRAIFDQNGKIPDTTLNDDSYFEEFRLKLAEPLPNKPNRLRNHTYETLESYKTRFDMRTIRNIIIKQISPKDDDSSMYEVFNRLNTGGINLKPQEIRTSMYHSKFYEMLYKANALPAWRDLLLSQQADIHMKDVEILLRSFALLTDVQNYAPSMVRFLNQFSLKARSYTDEQIDYHDKLFKSFLAACSNLPPQAFQNKSNRRFNIALYEVTFAATCHTAYAETRLLRGQVSAEQVASLATDPSFTEAMSVGTTQTKNVIARFNCAVNSLASL